MKWMKGLKNVENPNILQMIEDLDKNGWTEVGDDEEEKVQLVPDLHAAKWRNIDLEIDFESVQMQEFEREHADFVEEYEEAVRMQVEGHEDADGDDFGNPRHHEWIEWKQQKLEKSVEEKKCE